MSKPRILVVGHARHGKDTVALYMQKMHDYRFVSPSWMYLMEVIWPAIRGVYQTSTTFRNVRELAEMEIQYENVSDALEYKGEHRKLWFDLISEWLSGDLLRAARIVYGDGHIHCGIRRVDEFTAVCEEFNPYVVWVNSLERGVPPEPKESFQLTESMAHWVLDNSQGLPHLYKAIDNMVEEIETNSIQQEN